MKIQVLCLALAGLGGSAAAASFPESGLAGGARTLALGEASASALEGVESSFWNPAGLGAGQSNSLMAGHTAAMGGINSETLATQWYLGDYGNLGLQGFWDSLPGLDQRDAQGNLTGHFDYNTLGLGSGWAFHPFPSLSLGAGAQFLQQAVLESFPSELSASAGLQWRLRAATLGFAARRLGTDFAVFQPGAAWYFSPAERLDLLLAAGWLMEQEDSRAGAGMELSYDRSIDFRLGYQVPTSAASGLDGIANLSAGLGVTVKNLHFDYGLMFLGDLGQMHRFQVGYEWESVREK